ncbi:ACR023Wp [Eremothecium gossypii ATCC 10895]|uniref:ACR023Wp n=1 Tax=Eremothecium gossypii (strain ATCC 10895 / CBS 109.51 / FGSC 9923 / NRRL Y-1056) TaxID=284811 RepID=Q75C93_EREGS|nr:ACR023Wp [Eremothecium gossypii ATCC 10895]AAS51250.1 ACR023Wp [Eremothecium gossypii ATCC 10895]
MIQVPNAFISPPLATTLGPGADSLEDVMLRIGNKNLSTEEIKQDLLRLVNLLQDLKVSLKGTFSRDVVVSHMPQYFDWIQDGRGLFYPLYKCFSQIEPAMLKFLDPLEAQQTSGALNRDQVAIFNLIDQVSELVLSLKPLFQSVKNLFDTALEFNEIFKDHMNSLLEEIEGNMKKCLALHQDCFASPVRHPPSFTLDQLVELISSSSNNQRLQMPTFNPLEKRIYQDYCELENAIVPIQTSLRDVLKTRIQMFRDRDIINLNYLMRLLNHKYANIVEKYDHFHSELMALKAGIIDKRWNVLFTNLNMELASILTSVTRMYESLQDNPTISGDTRDTLIQQIQQKSDTIFKTFEVIYKALDASILNPNVAEVTNTLADKWLVLREKVDPILPKETESDPIDVLTKRMSDMTISEPVDSKPFHFDRSKRCSVGALLLRKMNIKPILTSDPDEAEKPKFNRSYRSPSSADANGSPISSDYPPVPFSLEPVHSKNPPVFKLQIGSPDQPPVVKLQNENVCTEDKKTLAPSNTATAEPIGATQMQLNPEYPCSPPPPGDPQPTSPAQNATRRPSDASLGYPGSHKDPQSPSAPFLSAGSSAPVSPREAPATKSPSLSPKDCRPEFDHMEPPDFFRSGEDSYTWRRDRSRNSSVSSASAGELSGKLLLSASPQSSQPGDFTACTTAPNEDDVSPTSLVSDDYIKQADHIKYIERIEEERFRYYANMHSRIPVMFSDLIPQPIHLSHFPRSPGTRHNYWSSRLKEPTPLADLLNLS